MTKRKLLFFGSGFLARHIIEQAYSEKNLEIKLLYNKHPQDDFPASAQKCIQHLDIIKFLASYLPDYLICVQGSSFVPDNKRLTQALENNVILTLSLLENILENKNIRKNIKKIIVVGSAGEYGRTYSRAISETFQLNPSSIYGLSKIFLYNLSMFYKKKGLPIVYVRQFNCAGPHQRDTFLIPSLCKQVACLEKRQHSSPIIELGDMKQERDFIDARDAAAAYVLLLKKGKPGEVYNIGSGKAHSVKKVLGLVLAASKLKNPKINIKVRKELLFKEHSLHNRILANNHKLLALGFKPKYRLEETIENTLEYWRKHV